MTVSGLQTRDSRVGPTDLRGRSGQNPPMHSADSIEEIPRPTMRGLSHAGAFFLAVAGAIWLIARGESQTAQIAASLYGVGLIALFGGSALYHRWPGKERWRPLLRRIDHSTIFLFIAASYAPVGLLVLDGVSQVLVLGLVCAGALAGVVFSLAWIDAPRALQSGMYVLLGWAVLIAAPQMFDRLELAPLLLFIAGGLLYTGGSVIYAIQRPDPWPETFGFHEIFHVLVIAAAVCHFVANAGWIIT